MINKVNLLGRIGTDPDSRQFEANEVTSINVATSKSYKKGDEWVEQTEWHNVSCWGSMSDKAKSFRKGDLVWVEGELNTRKYEKEGITHYRTGIKASYVRKIPTGQGGQLAGGLQGNAFAPVESSNNQNDLPF